MPQFIVKGEYIELIALLKATGMASSGGQAKLMVEDGLVKVNSESESRKRRKVRKGDLVEVSGIVFNIL